MAKHTAALLQQLAWVGRCGREKGIGGGVAAPAAALLQQHVLLGRRRRMGWVVEGSAVRALCRG